MFRIQPNLPVRDYKTYRVSAPLATHWRPGSCEEVDCDAYVNGWRTVLDESNELGQRQAFYVRTESGRAYTEHRDEQGLTVFTFGAGQPCFTTHQVSLEREPLYLVRDGDWRGNPTGAKRLHVRADDWVDDFATHQDHLATRLDKG